MEKSPSAPSPPAISSADEHVITVGEASDPPVSYIEDEMEIVFDYDDEAKIGEQPLEEEEEDVFDYDDEAKIGEQPLEEEEKEDVFDYDDEAKIGEQPLEEEEENLICTLRTTQFRSSIALVSRAYAARGKDAAIQHAFQLMDVDKNGRLDHREIKAFFQAAADETMNLRVEQHVIVAAVDALMEDVGVEEGTNFMTQKQFWDLFERHPDLLAVFEDSERFSLRCSKVVSRRSGIINEMLQEEDESQEVLLHSRRTQWKNKKLHWSGNINEMLQEEEDENQEVWLQSRRTQWKNKKLHLAWFTLWFVANVFAFTYKGIQYARKDEAMDVFGNCIIVARGSANCINLNAALVLLPVCRHFLTRLRATQLRFWVPFDSMLEYHIYTGMAIAVFATTHVAAHVCDFHRFSKADEQDIYDLVGDKLGNVPDGRAARWRLLLSTRAGVTGIIMVVCMAVAYPFTLRRREAFNSFWFTHHLLLVMLIALCIHGTGNLLEHYQTVYWLIFPLSLYFLRRVYRERPCSKLDVIEANVLKGGVVHLKLARPKEWENFVHAGMYGVINIPNVSRIEWHPFTLASAPCEDFVEFYFRNVGDWTGNVHRLIEDTTSVQPKSEAREESETPDLSKLVVKVEGPIGASSQGFSDYPVLVLVGAGIGVTPMISVLKQLLANPGKMKRVFFYWTTRDPTNLELFSQLVDKIYESDQKHVIQLRHFLTSAKEDDRDLGAVLFHHATRSKHKRTNFDILLGRHVRHKVAVGRPDWAVELKSIKAEAKDELGFDTCGMFMCGPQRMAEAIAEASFDVSSKDPNFHFYFTKETF